MEVEIVDDNANDLGFWIIPVHELLHAPSAVLFGAPRSHFYVAPAAPRLEEHKQITRAVALIVRIVPLGVTRLRRQWLAYFSNQLVWTLIEAHHGKARVIGLGIQIQDILHAPHKLATDCRDTPLLL